MEKNMVIYDITAQHVGDTNAEIISTVSTEEQAREVLATVVNEYTQALIGADAKLGLIGRAAYAVNIDEHHVFVIRTATRRVVEFAVCTRLVVGTVDPLAIRRWAEIDVEVDK